MSSNYKEQLVKILKQSEIAADSIVSIGGGQEDDHRYFGKVECDEYVVLDNDIRFKPQIIFDMNSPIITPEGDLGLSHEWQEYFGIAIALNIWEYIYDPVTAHSNIALLLKSGGELITNYPFVYPMHEPRGIDYLRYTPDGYRKFLSMAGFQITEEIPIIGNNQLVSFYQADRMKARVNENHSVIGMVVRAKKN